MKKAVKWVSIILGSLIGLLVVAAIAFPFIFPLEKIKDMAAEKISEAIHREVKIEKVSFNIFEGVRLEKLTVSNRAGFANKPFVSADAIVLRYAFWPLFQRQIVVKELRLESPAILIERSAAGTYNFSDMMQAGTSKPKPEKKEDKGLPFSLVVDTFSIRNGKITYADRGTNTSSEIKKANLTVSGVTLALLKPVGLKFSSLASYQGKDIPLALSGDIGVDLAKETIKIPALSLEIAGEKANIAATVSNLKLGPSIDLAISSGGLSLDPLLAIFSAGAAKKTEKLPYGALTKNLSRSLASIPSRLKLNAKIDINNLKSQDIVVDRIDLGISLANKILTARINQVKAFEGTFSGNATVNLAVYGLAYTVSGLKLAGLNAAPFSNMMVENFLTKLPDYKDLANKAYGTLDASLSLSGKGVEAPDIMANASARGSFKLTDGELKRLKTIDAIADNIKSPALKQDLKISELSSNFTYQGQTLNIEGLSLIDHDLRAGFNGGLNLANLSFVSGNRLDIKASPGVTKDLPKEYNLFRDDQGWVKLTFELRGPLKKPIPFPILKEAFDKGVEKVKAKVQEKAQEEVDKVKEAVQKKAEEEKSRLREEAEKKAKELLKF